MQTGSVEDDPPLEPCDWLHAYHGEIADGVKSGYGSWCAPADEWKIPSSLLP